jgi:hypothetical protein
MVDQLQSTISRDPNDPIWTSPSPDALPPLEAYRYFPIGNDLRNKGQRFVYGGNTQFEKEEEEKYAKLEVFLKEHKRDLSTVPDDFYTKPEILKIFWAVKFSHEETVKAMVEYYDWRQKTLPVQPAEKGI